ncbi:chemotaxis protein CheW [Desulfopila sp. IMCC35006]|uniref:chemotaxis protein CheW n=1 Tax=Desulfopila sp. IMCC35006 TaxID=2569542 RepID=UPI0010ACBB49|nr:chemotaxis protein CheW [Desulfopila sp. IMCC35006]TKB25059.1 chemotaxis protein CheW [Desulfopila sp. IMCC35006]
MSRMLALPDLIANIDAQLAEVTDRADAIARQAAADREEPRRYILVGIGTLHLAIAIDDLSEVGPLPTVTVLPHLPGWIQGIVNIRSEIVSVIDFGTFIRYSDSGCAGRRLAVLRYKKRKIGIRLDRIVGTVSRVMSETKPLAMIDRHAVDTTLFTAGLLIEESFYYILNVPMLLTLQRLVDYNRRG